MGDGRAGARERVQLCQHSDGVCYARKASRRACKSKPVGLKAGNFDDLGADLDPLTEVCIAGHRMPSLRRRRKSARQDAKRSRIPAKTGGRHRQHEAMSIRRHCRSASTHCNCSVLNFGRKLQSTSTAISVHTRDRFSMSRTELRAQAAVYHKDPRQGSDLT